jgi:hypothetical protein
LITSLNKRIPTERQLLENSNVIQPACPAGRPANSIGSVLIVVNNFYRLHQPIKSL